MQLKTIFSTIVGLKLNEYNNYFEGTHRTIKWADSSLSVDSRTSIYMSAQKTQLTDG
jgi:hypothetical protein